MHFNEKIKDILLIELADHVIKMRSLKNYSKNEQLKMIKDTTETFIPTARYRKLEKITNELQKVVFDFLKEKDENEDSKLN